jgi:RNA polymerase sigma-70 factor (ECF subfamily)
MPEGYRTELDEVNGQPALVVRADGRAFLVLTIEVQAQQIRAVRLIANPEKLAHV